jgi:hypothetical protein
LSEVVTGEDDFATGPFKLLDNVVTNFSDRGGCLKELLDADSPGGGKLV